MSISSVFSKAREEFRSKEKLFEVALSVEVSKLNFALHDTAISIVRVEQRLKDFNSIRDNYIKHSGTPNQEVEFSNFMKSCTDLIGLRVVTLYNSDLNAIEEKITAAFGLPPENRVFNEQDIRKGSEFGYRATHWKYGISDEFVRRHLPDVSIFAELQIRSVLSDAWARHSHSLLYKSGEEPSDRLIRDFGIASATIEGLDNRLDELFEAAGTMERRPYTEEVARTSLASALEGILGQNLGEGEVDTIATLLDLEVSETSDSYGALIDDARAAWQQFGEKDFAGMGVSEPEQKLKLALFGFNKDKYMALVSPHQRKRAADLLATF